MLQGIPRFLAAASETWWFWGEERGREGIFFTNSCA